MTDADRELMRMLAAEMQALRASNTESRVASGEIGERFDALVQKLGAQLVIIDDRLSRIEHAHDIRLGEHSTDLADTIARVHAIERGVLWTRAWAAGRECC